MRDTPYRDEVRSSVQRPYGFMSYGRNPWSPESDRPPNERLRRFHTRLTEHLVELTDLDAGIPAVYLDQRIPIGTDWQDELKLRLARCQVLVPVLAPRLFSSRWCELEWDCFERRQQLHRDRGTFIRSAVVPVLWAPLRPADIPRPYSQVQYAHQDFHPDYQRLGLLGLHNHGRHKVFNEVAYQLAQKIVEVAVSARLDPCEPHEFDSLFASANASLGEKHDV